MDAGIIEMLDYDRWATSTLIAGCGTLEDAPLDARLPGFSGSSRELFLHLVGGQQTFMLRTLGRQHEGELNRPSPWPGWPELARISAEAGEALLGAARRLDPDSEVALPYGRRRYVYPVRFFLVHAAGHGAEHRTEIKLQLGQQGVETPDLDGWQYATAKGYGAVATT